MADQWLRVTASMVKQLGSPRCDLCGMKGRARQWWYNARTRKLRCDRCHNPGGG